MKNLRSRCAKIVACSLVLSVLPLSLFTIFDQGEVQIVQAQSTEICDGIDNNGNGQIDEIFGCYSCQSGNRFGFRNAQYCIDWGNHSTDFRTACNQYGGRAVFIDDRAEYDVLAANWNTSFGPSNHYGMLTGSSCSDIRARSDLHPVSNDLDCSAPIMQMDRPSKGLNDTFSDANHYRTVYCEIEEQAAPQCSDGKDNDGDGKIDFGGSKLEFINATSAQSFVNASNATKIDAPGHAYANVSVLNLGPLTLTRGPSNTEFTGNIAPYHVPPASNRVAISNIENFNIDLPSNIYGFGFEMFEPRTHASINAAFVDSTFVFTFKQGGNVVHTMSVNSDNDVVRFHGVWLNERFDRIEIREVTGSHDNEFFGSFYFTTTPRGNASGDPGCSSPEDNDERDEQCGPPEAAFIFDTVLNSGNGNMTEAVFLPNGTHIAEGQFFPLNVLDGNTPDPNVPGFGVQRLRNSFFVRFAGNHRRGREVAAGKVILRNAVFTGVTTDPRHPVEGQGDGKANAPTLQNLRKDTRYNGEVFTDGSFNTRVINDEDNFTFSYRHECTQPLPQCSDSKDNDNDGKIDAGDPGCHSDGNPHNGASYTPNRDSEVDQTRPQCSDGKDNDGDGKIDCNDPGCHSDGNVHNFSSCNPGDNDEKDPVSGGPDLDIVKELIGRAVPGQEVTFKVTATNVGGAPAKYTVMVDKFPDELTFVRGKLTPQGKPCRLELPGTEHEHVFCDVGTLNAGAEQVAELTFRLSLSARCGGNFMNEADVNARGGITDWGKLTVPVTCGGQSSSSSSSSSSSRSSDSSSSSSSPHGNGPAKLAVKQTCPSSVQKDGVIMCEIVALNLGGVTAGGVVVASHKVGGLTFESGQSTLGCIDHGGHIACSVGALHGGKDTSVTVAYKVTEGCGGVVKSKAVAQGAGGLSSPVDIDATDVVCGPVSSSSSSSSEHSSSSALSSSSSKKSSSSSSSSSAPLGGLKVKKTGPTSANKGETVKYTIQASNGGTPVGGAVIADHYPKGFKFVPGLSSPTCVPMPVGNPNHIWCPIAGGTLGPAQGVQEFTLTFTLVPNEVACSANSRNRVSLAAAGGAEALDEADTFVSCP